MTLLLALLLAWPGAAGPAAAQSRATPAGTQTTTRAASQTTASGTLLLEVLDATGGVLPAATVTLRQRGTRTAEVVSDDRGAANLTLPAGRYEVTVALDGFDTVTRSVTIATGRSQRLRVELALSRLAETVTVDVVTTGVTETSIGEAQLEAIADDPDALDAFIAELTGGEAEVRVDGFSGGRTPRTSEVAQIVVISDPYSAQFHTVGQSQVNVVTKPGLGAWHGWAGSDLATRGLQARDVFASARLDYRRAGGWFSASGPIRRARTSVTLDGYLRRDSQETPALALNGAGAVKTATPVRDHNQSLMVRTTTAVGQALLRNHIEVERASRAGAGVNDLDLPERALGTTRTRVMVRSGLTAALRGGIEQDLRFSGSWLRDTQTPVTEARTIVVLGAFRSGGAQTRGATRVATGQAEANWKLPPRRGHHLRTGLSVDATDRRSASLSNYLGTFVFASLADFALASPLTFTQRIGTSEVRVRDLRSALYLHDQVQLRPTLQAGLGLRYEWQPAVHAQSPAPRLSLAWVRPKGLTVRGGLGRFFGWYETGLLEEARRLDGSRFSEIILQSPAFPDPLGSGALQSTPPSTRVIAAPDVTLSSYWRASLTVERRVWRLGLRATASGQLGREEPRARNLNVPVGGVRPDPSVGNLLRIMPLGRSDQAGLDLGVNSGSLWGKRLQATLNYSLSRARNDADGALSLPADSQHPTLEWGPSRNDIRHRLTGSLNLKARGVTLGLYTRAQSGLPYNITTGQDDNGDTVTNDRPAGVGRNTGRGTGRSATDLRVSWGRSVGGRRVAAGAGARTTRQGGKSLGATLSVSNLFNQRQNAGFNGVLSSPLFGRATSALTARRVSLSAQLGF